METIFLKSELVERLKPHFVQGQSIGLVPTMGALHKGHLSLIETCAHENDVVVVSIFVNPTQFNNPTDLEKYPRDLKRDQLLLQHASSKPIFVFAPNVKEIYSNQIESGSFDFQGLELEMEGKFRPGHFDGVATIVSKLLAIVKPQNAYFGEKDYQQLLIIKKTVEILELPVNIRPCPIFRENDGLAMSSRNERLSKEQRAVSPLIYKVLETAKSMFGIESVQYITQWVENQFQKEPLLNLEYFEIAEANTLKPVVKTNNNIKYRAFVAVFAGDVRLIDNIALN